MILFALLLQATPLYDDPGDAPPVPDAASQAYGDYVGCLSDPLEAALTSGEPRAESGRVALVRTTLASCTAERAAADRALDTALAVEPAFADRAPRRARIDEILGKMEQRVAFSLVRREALLDIAETLRRCRNEGRTTGECAPKQPNIPLPEIEQ